jgi:hypothetical protein
MITSLLPAWPGTRICLRLRQHGLNPVHLVQCLFLLSSPFPCVAYSCAVVDKKDHTTGAIHMDWATKKVRNMQCAHVHTNEKPLQKYSFILLPVTWKTEKSYFFLSCIIYKDIQK